MLKELDVTGTLMLACASASLAAHIGLKTVLGWTTKGDPDTLAHTLTAGVRDLESAKPGIAIANMAMLARREPVVAAAIGQGQCTTLEQIAPGPTREALGRFMQDFGDRAVREAELATPRWVEQPQQVLAMLATALQNRNHDPDHVMLGARLRAEQEMAVLESKLGPVQATAVRALVAHARRTMRLRERMRAWVTRTLGAIRRGALEAERRMRRRDPTLEPGAAFFCTMEELLRDLAAHDLQLGHLVRMRRAEHARDERRPDPPVTFVGRPPPIVLPPAGEAVLQGLPASAGVVEGRVRVLPPGREVLAGLEPGEILVARTTDVGLTPLFLLAAGVVTELGGPLSHAALVAREYGVPTVVNVTGATLVLRNGDRIRVDGDRGTVERLDAR
jgi:pyruvate,water dikinase